MSERTEIEFVNDILEAVRRISRYLGGLSYDDFRKDTKTQNAVIRNIEVIGEAAKGVTEEWRLASILISYGRWPQKNCPC